MPRDDMNTEYSTEQVAIAVREWATQLGGWLWANPNTEDQWLTCPACSATERKKMSVRHLSLVGKE